MIFKKIKISYKSLYYKSLCRTELLFRWDKAASLKQCNELYCKSRYSISRPSCHRLAEVKAHNCATRNFIEITKLCETVVTGHTPVKRFFNAYIISAAETRAVDTRHILSNACVTHRISSCASWAELIKAFLQERRFNEWVRPTSYRCPNWCCFASTAFRRRSHNFVTQVTGDQTNVPCTRYISWNFRSKNNRKKFHQKFVIRNYSINFCYALRHIVNNLKYFSRKSIVN